MRWLPLILLYFIASACGTSETLFGKDWVFVKGAAGRTTDGTNYLFTHYLNPSIKAERWTFYRNGYPVEILLNLEGRRFMVRERTASGTWEHRTLQSLEVARSWVLAHERFFLRNQKAAVKL